jgi:fluoroquinolone transport system permease protein
MLQRFLNSFTDDCRYIVRHPILLAALLYPLITILFLRFVVPPVSELIFSRTGFRLGLYYTIIAITLISAIPAVFGFIFASIHLNNSELNRLNIDQAEPANKKSLLYFRMIVAILLSIITLYLTDLITDPVPSEGWLRSLFVTFLLAVQSPFVLLFILSFSGSRAKVILLTKLYGIFLITVPLGLLLHHPWNYAMFFSPLYWISWAWVTYTPSESLFYGAISIVISFGFNIWSYRHFIRKNQA